MENIVDLLEEERRLCRILEQKERDFEEQTKAIRWSLSSLSQRINTIVKQPRAFSLVKRETVCF